MFQQNIALLFILAIHTVAMGLPEVNTARLLLRGKILILTKGSKAGVMVIFLLLYFKCSSYAGLFPLPSRSAFLATVLVSASCV